MAALAGALGIGVLALKGLLQGGDSSEAALQRARAGIHKRIAQASVSRRPPDPPEDITGELDVSPKKKAARELRRLKAMRAHEEEEQLSLVSVAAKE
jgi:hypothetical protein